MFGFFRSALCTALVLLVYFGTNPSFANDAGIIRGRVFVKNLKTPLKGASVKIIQLGMNAVTDAQGCYEFRNVPAGAYDLAAHMHALLEDVVRVEVVSGQTAEVDFQLSLVGYQQEVVVTASAREVSLFDSFQAISVLDTLEVAGKGAFGLGELTENLPGVAKRAFGPGSARPVLRGFDGDRVLVLYNGLPAGTLSSQSGEHAEPVDETNLDRIEIVKGPATLLYGSNAIGGVVNVISQHHLVHEHAHTGLRAGLHVSGGSNNRQAATGARLEYGVKKWLFWLGGRRHVAGDYHSPEGRVDNSKTRLTSGHAGLGWFNEKSNISLNYAFSQGRFGVPFAGQFHHHHEYFPEGHAGEDDHEIALVDETFTWQNLQLGAGVNGIGSVAEKFRFSSSFVRWMHRELENDAVATEFDNKLWNFRGVFEQRKFKSLSGRFGLQASHRNYVAEGEESLTPPVVASSFAIFALEELDFKKARFQFGARIESTGYDAAGLPDRSFNGFSAATGIHVPLRKNSAFVANYTLAHRAPALEELYNNGPHVGNLAFEIGNPGLRRELSNGLDLMLRHGSERMRMEANLFYYRLRDFVYLALTGEQAHGLRVARYAQGDACFAGGEAGLDLRAHSNLWINLGLDAVRSNLVDGNVPLPRIPPLRFRMGMDASYKSFRFKPEVQISARQSRIYLTETPTAGYGVLNLTASYVYAKDHLAHVFSVSLLNASNRLYRNHLSFIKDLAPEMGRSIRFSYSLQIF